MRFTDPAERPQPVETPRPRMQETPERDMWIGVAIGVALAVPCWAATLWVFFG